MDVFPPFPSYPARGGSARTSFCGKREKKRKENILRADVDELCSAVICRFAVLCMIDIASDLGVGSGLVVADFRVFIFQKNICDGANALQKLCGGSEHTVVVTETGSVYAWGSGEVA